MQDAPAHRLDRVLGVGIQVEAEALPVVAVAGAAQFDREFERLHERGGADHVVVVERAPAGVRMLVPEEPLRGQQRRVLGEALAVHQQVLPVHVDLDVRDAARAERVDDVERHPDVAHEDLHRRLGVLVLEEEHDAALLAARRDLPDAVDEPRPRVAVGRLERVVVALDSGPEDHLRADRPGEVGGRERFGERGVADAVVRGGEPPAAELRIEVRPGRDCVDAVVAQDAANLVEVPLRELLRVVELVVVDEIAEPVDCPADALGHRLVRPLRLIAARDEARHHRPEGPDAE